MWKMNRLLLIKRKQKYLDTGKQARQFMQNTARFIGLSQQQQVSTVFGCCLCLWLCSHWRLTIKMVLLPFCV